MLHHVSKTLRSICNLFRAISADEDVVYKTVSSANNFILELIKVSLMSLI